MDRNKAQQFLQKAVGDIGTAMASALVCVGERAGLFRAMAGAGLMSAQDLAQRTGTHPRQIGEWLAAMTTAGYVEHEARGDEDLFRLPDEFAMFLTDPQAESWLGGLFGALPSVIGVVPQLTDALMRGDGVSFRDYGDAMPIALEQMNRNLYEKSLVSKWLPLMPEVVRRLEAGGRALDVGCGTGVAAVLIAQAFPQARIDALDLDARSIAMAQARAEQAGVADRVRFRAAPAESLAPEERYDLITTFDVIHDLPDPGGVLRRIRAALAEGGSYLMVEPNMQDSLAENCEHPFARMLYGISCLHCVPQSLAQGGPGLGACWGPTRARAFARDAGFTSFETLPIRKPALAFHELKA